MSHNNLVICGDWLDRLRQKSLDLKKVLALLIIDILNEPQLLENVEQNYARFERVYVVFTADRGRLHFSDVV
eukprot:CAMPEP_0170467228 /NCGR_PEP_ID=MMETSP0123-20130129/10878_1 /TAXON_ID=182087 /ORGANISM="Favella ehrenbergii, Strain Fehren 1" /LENGTH=71 /DNA_ID=CAMNT_0010733527 /DNA_START=386 /DNA_END=601 /DNA_ORIENTATION=-